MKLQSAVYLLAIIVFGALFAGCQSSGLTMPKLAFWQKDDKLDPSKLEPPSRQFTPSQTEVAEKGDKASNLDSGEGPPVRPDIASTKSNETTIEEIERDLNRNFAEQVNRAKTAEQEIIDKVATAHDGAMDTANSINQAIVDTKNVSMPPAKQQMDGSSRPLTPRYATSSTMAGAAGNPAPGGNGMADRNLGGFTPPTGSFATSSTPAYEKLAASTSGGFNPLQPANPALAQSAPMSVAASDSAAGNTAGNKNPPSFGGGSFGGGSFAPQGQGSSAPQFPSSLASTANAPPQNPTGVTSGSSMFPPFSANTTTPASTAATTAATGPKYESTPYKAFEPGRPADTSIAVSQTGQMQSSALSSAASQIPATLQLSGQGSYAPGSVRIPQMPQATASNPSQPGTSSPASGGGSFVR